MILLDYNEFNKFSKITIALVLKNTVKVYSISIQVNSHWTIIFKNLLVLP